MIHECIEANPEKFARYAKIATVIGWILLIGSAVVALPTLYQYGRIVGFLNIYRLQGFLLQIIIPVCFGMFFLMIGQFLKCELQLEERPGWLFRNGSVILKCYAAVLVVTIIIQYVNITFSVVKSHNSFGKILWYLFTTHLMYMLHIAKVLLLWGMAGVVKMMMDEIRKKDGAGG